MNILQLAPHDSRGGASRIAWYLFEEARKRGVTSVFGVGRKVLADSDIRQIDHSVGGLRGLIAKGRRRFDVTLGRENFNFPGTSRIPEMFDNDVDLIHAHNLQGKYFDLRALPGLSRQYPFLITLHDTWMLAGHCAYFIECERWRDGCGACPDLNRAPAIQRDATRYNWRRKEGIYAKSRLFVATPSQWLMDQAKASMLAPAIRIGKVIHNGVNQDIFCPGDGMRARRQLDIADEAIVLLYVVASQLKHNADKDYDTIAAALGEIRSGLPSDQKVVFLGLGSEAPTEIHGNLEMRFLSYQTDLGAVASIYRAADLYLHAARADTFPNAILEALACGTPVVATDVGGIGEQVDMPNTGLLVQAGSGDAMARGVLELLDNSDRRRDMSRNAADDARIRFTLDRMVDDYLEFYDQILSELE